MKIRLQLQTTEKLSVSQTFKGILRNEGVVGLWKGNVPAEVMYILYGAAQFTSYSILNKALTTVEDNTPRFKLPGSTHSLVVGMGAGVSSTIFTYPFDLLRTRMAANSNRELLSMVKTVGGIWRKDGLTGFFLGVRPALVSVASNAGLMFWTYEVAREYSHEYRTIPFIEAICGFLAGASSKGLTFPLDTLRKRIQMRKVDQGANSFQIIKTILRNEGILGLYKGFGVSVLKNAPTSAISLFMYEYALSVI